MRALAASAVLWGGAWSEIFTVGPRSEMSVGIRVPSPEKSIRINLAVEGDRNPANTIEITDPTGEIVKKFRNEEEISFLLVPKSPGDHTIKLVNHSNETRPFSVELPETSAGPFSSKTEINLGKDLEMLLQNIILSQKSLLARKTQHLEQAKVTKSWIKKLTVIELVLCLYILYYVHGEAVKTFYSKRKV